MGHARNCLSKDVELGLTVNEATKCGSHVLSCSENGGHSLRELSSLAHEQQIIIK